MKKFINITSKNTQTKYLDTVIKILTVIVFIVILSLLYYYNRKYFEDGHQTNLRYIAWKMHLAPYDPSVTLRFLNVDSNFRRSLKGKTLSKVLKWFPDLRPPEKANNYQKYYNHLIDEFTFFWIGDSAWGIIFENGKLKDFILLKG